MTFDYSRHVKFTIFDLYMLLASPCNYGCYLLLLLSILADTRVNHTGVLAVGNYLGFSLAVGIFTFVVNSLYGFNYVKINL